MNVSPLINIDLFDDKDCNIYINPYEKKILLKKVSKFSNYQITVYTGKR